jgi:peptidoglycan/LPS O-acetylase OafA/YrhL
VSEAANIPAKNRDRSDGALALSDFSAHPGHVPSLDGLRAVSVALVVFGHLVNDHLFPGGLGVLIFFVISGFLITRLMIIEFRKAGTVNLRKFYERRMLRLYPAVATFAVVASIGYLIFARSKFNVWEPLSALFYFANYFYNIRELYGPPTTMPFSQFWSLSIEEHYYAFFPIILLWSRAAPKRLIVVALIACASSLLLRLGYAIAWPDLLDKHLAYSHTETRIDSIAAGVLIAAAAETIRGREILRWLTSPIPVVTAALTTLFCLLFRDPFFRETIRYTLLNAATATIICAVVFSDRYRPANWLLNSALFVWIGELSYSLYVWHEATAQALIALMPSAPHLLRIVIIFAAVIAVSAASYYGPEALARNWRKRLHLR